jgi:hypothetical protein
MLPDRDGVGTGQTMPGGMAAGCSGFRGAVASIKEKDRPPISAGGPEAQARLSRGAAPLWPVTSEPAFRGNPQ